MVPSAATEPSLWHVVAVSALVSGWGEGALRMAAKQFGSQPVFIDPASLWAAPASAGVVLLLPVSLAWALGSLRGAGARWRWALAVALFFTTLDVLLLVPRIHPAALLLAAAGVASQGVRLASRFAHRLRPLMRGTIALLGTASLVGAVGLLIERQLSDRRAFAQSSAVPSDAPNVLFIILDTVRAMQLSAYGYGRPTSPHLDALASEGVRFDRAVSTAPWTLPSHATLFTGRYPAELSTGWNTPLDKTPATLAERFSARGYVTGGFVANFRYTTHEYGLGRGFEVYRDYALTWSQFLGSIKIGRRAIGLWNDLTHRYVLPGRKGGDLVVDEFLAFESSRGARPFFAFLNFFDAHEPYAPAAPYDRIFLDAEPRTRAIEIENRLDTAAVRELRDAYDGSLASVDAALGRLFDTLRARGELERTIVVVTSDHGEEFAEHGLLSHGGSLNFPALHVPLIVRWPAGGVPRAVVVRTPVSLRDVPATIVQLSGDPQPTTFPGVSLAPLWSDQAAARSPIVSELFWVSNQPAWYPVAAGSMHSLVEGRFHLIAGPGEREELYDVVADPFEHRDLRNNPALTDTLQAMRSALAARPMGDRRGR